MWSADRDSREAWAYLRDERELMRSLVLLMENRQRTVDMLHYSRSRLGSRLGSRAGSRGAGPLRVSRVTPTGIVGGPARVMRQIENATETLTFGEVRGNDENVEVERICPITRSEFEDNTQVLRIRGCGHYATEGPMRRWLTERGTCPVCRAEVAQVGSAAGGINEDPTTPAALVEQLTQMIAGDLAGVSTSPGQGQTVFEYRMDVPSA